MSGGATCSTVRDAQHIMHGGQAQPEQSIQCSICTLQGNHARMNPNLLNLQPCQFLSQQQRTFSSAGQCDVPRTALSCLISDLSLQCLRLRHLWGPHSSHCHSGKMHSSLQWPLAHLSPPCHPSETKVIGKQRRKLQIVDHIVNPKTWQQQG